MKNDESGLTLSCPERDEWTCSQARSSSPVWPDVPSMSLRRLCRSPPPLCIRHHKRFTALLLTNQTLPPSYARASGTSGKMGPGDGKKTKLEYRAMCVHLRMCCVSEDGVGIGAFPWLVWAVHAWASMWCVADDRQLSFSVLHTHTRLWRSCHIENVCKQKVNYHVQMFPLAVAFSITSYTHNYRIAEQTKAVTQTGYTKQSAWTTTTTHKCEHMWVCYINDNLMFVPDSTQTSVNSIRQNGLI